MTTMPDAFAMSGTAQEHAALLATIAQTVAGLVPASSPLRPTAASAGALSSASGFSGAALVTFNGVVDGGMTILVRDTLMEALNSSPMGALDLGAALQPAFDAAAEVLGTSAAAARTVTPDEVIDLLGYPFTVVPLVAGTSPDEAPTAQLLLRDSTLQTAADAMAAAAAVVPPTSNGASMTGPATTASALAALTSQPTGIPVTGGRGLEMLHGVIMDVTVELGRTQMSIRELLALSPGTVLELDRAAGSPADLLVNGRLIARGEVVVVDEDFGLRVTEIVDANPTT